MTLTETQQRLKILPTLGGLLSLEATWALADTSSVLVSGRTLDDSGTSGFALTLRIKKDNGKDAQTSE